MKSFKVDKNLGCFDKEIDKELEEMIREFVLTDKELRGIEVSFLAKRENFRHEIETEINKVANGSDDALEYLQNNYYGLRYLIDEYDIVLEGKNE